MHLSVESLPAIIFHYIDLYFINTISAGRYLLCSHYRFIKKIAVTIVRTGGIKQQLSAAAKKKIITMKPFSLPPVSSFVYLTGHALFPALPLRQPVIMQTICTNANPVKFCSNIQSRNRPGISADLGMPNQKLGVAAGKRVIKCAQ